MMNQRAKIIKMHNGKRNRRPFIISEPIMPREVEKEIILDAIGSFILSCDAKETDEFTKAISDTIVSACVMVFGNHTNSIHHY